MLASTAMEVIPKVEQARIAKCAHFPATGVRPLTLMHTSAKIAALGVNSHLAEHCARSVASLQQAGIATTHPSGYGWTV